jgi:HAD superfamily hydrolase (TIGR01509 family)
LTEDNISPLFSIVITTGQKNLDKTNPEIYQLALKRLCVLAGEAIFIDNSAKYVRSAEKAGIKSIFYTKFEKLENPLHALGINA